MTFKTTMDSETVHHVENGLTFCGRMNVEVDLDIFDRKPFQTIIDFVFIEIEGQLYKFTSLNEHDQKQIAQWVSDRLSEFSSYVIDMKLIAAEIAAGRSYDDVQGGVA